MSGAIAVRCDGCGGAVQLRAGVPKLSQCVFCGESADHLRPTTLSAQDLAPTSQAPAVLDAEQVLGRFRKWRGSFSMAPFAVSRAAVQVRLVYVPAVRFGADLETHWVGIRPNQMRPSRKQPAVGVDREVVEAFVAATRALRPLELRALGPFGAEYQEVGAAHADAPVEVGALTERGLRQRGLWELAERHRVVLAERHRLSSVHGGSLEHSLRSEVVLVPVWIGAYPLRGQPWRWMANGVTGVVVGSAPWSRVKVGLLFAVFGSLVTFTPLPLLGWLGFVALWKLGVVHD